MKAKYFLFYTLILIFIIGCDKEQVQEQKNQIEIQTKVIDMKLTSPAFQHNGQIPSEFT